MKQFTTLLLDADGTLFDFDACEREAFRMTFEKYGYGYSDDILRRYSEINKAMWKSYELGEASKEFIIYERFRKLFKEIGISNDGNSFEDDYQMHLGMQHIYLPDAPQVIGYLYKKYDLYIVTNGVTQTQYRRFRESGVDRYMKDIFVSEETGFQKPMMEYFDYCFRRIENLELSKTMIIGDSLSSDIKGGNNAGITTCWYNPKSNENHTDIRADYEIKSLKELYELL